MNRIKYISILLFGFGLLSQMSCTSYKLHLHDSVKEWEKAEMPQDQQPIHQVYLLGDAGDSPPGDTAASIKLYHTHLADALPNSTALFLGDNIYPVGLAPADHKDHELGKHRIQVQLEACRGFKGRPIFIPGNHDWYTYHQEGIRREEKFIEESLEKMRGESGNYFIPNQGCGEPYRVDVDEKITVLLIDSQWYLKIGEATDNNPACPGWNRDRFWASMEALGTELAEREVLLVMHHPLYTNGKHGGYFSWRHHLFPLTEVKHFLWIPLPVIGSLYPILRRNKAVVQDVRNKQYQEMKKRLLQVASKHGRFTIAAGHEHALQYFEVNGQPCIVSGAGSKNSAVRGGKGALFAYSHEGCARLDYYADGQVWLRFFAVGEGEVFRRKIWSKREN